MATDHDIRCSNACTRAGISLLALSAVAFGMFSPLDKSRNLGDLLEYINQRLVLKEQVTRLETDPAWRALMASDAAEQARNDWNLAKLLDYTFRDELKPRYPGPKTEPPTQPPPVPGAPMPGTNLRFVVIRRIEPLHRAADALGALGNGDMLTRARRYSASADRAIFDWTSLRHSFFSDGWARNNPGTVLLPNESRTEPRSLLSRFFSVGEQNFVPTLTRDYAIKNLTVTQLIELGNYESPTVPQGEALLKEQASITLPTLGVAVSVFRGSTLVEFGILLSLAYFWLYYREARVSQLFPSSATLFGGFARTSLTRWIFFWCPAVPAVAAAVLAKKSFWLMADNTLIAVLVVVMAIVIQHCGRLPESVREEGETGSGW